MLLQMCLKELMQQHISIKSKKLEILAQSFVVGPNIKQALISWKHV